CVCACLAIIALRTRVSMSAIGSVIILYFLLPTRLGHAGDFPLQGQLAEAEAAHRESPEVRTRAPAQATPVSFADPELGGPDRLVDLSGRGHLSSSRLSERH